MNKKIIAILLVFTHLLCILLGYNIATTHSKSDNTYSTPEVGILETHEAMETQTATTTKALEEPSTTEKSTEPLKETKPVDTQPPVAEPKETQPPVTESTPTLPPPTELPGNETPALPMM